MNRDKDFSYRAAFAALTMIEEQHAETLAAIRAEAEGLTGRKADKAAIDTDNTGLWSHTRALAEACDAATIDAENVKLTRFVFSEAMSNLCEGDAAKTLASYASTGGKLIEQVRAGRLAWATLPEGWQAVRQAMKPDHKKAIDEKAKELQKVIGRIKRHKVPAHAMAALVALIEAAEGAAVQADASRKTKNAEAAAELDGLRQQAPSEASELEVKAA